MKISVSRGFVLRVILLNLLFIFVIGTAHLLAADEATAPNPPKRALSLNSGFRERKGMHVFVFQAGAGMMLDLQDRVRGAASVVWAPTYHFNSVVSARFNVGIVVRNAFARQDLTVGDFSITLIEKPKYNSPLFGELGAGVQYWTGHSSRKFYPELKAGFGYQFGNAEDFIKSFQVSYAYPVNTPLKTHQLLGVFTFGF